MFYDTPEWRETIVELERGLGPQEFISITLSDATVAKLPSKDAQKGFFVAVKREVKRRKLSVDVKSRAGFDGKPEIYCVGR